MLAIVVLGGMGSQLGVAHAALTLIGGFELFRGFDQYRMLVFGLAMVLLALTNALSYYGIATHRLAFTLPLLISTLGTLAAIATIHATLATVVRIMVVGNSVAVLAVALSLVIQRNTAGRRSTV